MENTEQLIEQIIKAIGDDPTRPGVIDTPKRVAKAYKELFEGYHTDPKSVLQKTFEPEGYSNLVLIKDIEYFSFCEHHMLPFFGVAHVAYIPDKKLVGLSKIPRLVELCARRLHNQERLTAQIGQALQETLGAKGVAVYLDGKHLCMCARGVKKPSANTITTSYSGAFETPQKQQEFLMHIKQ